jgi:hypothetical protein
MLLFAQRSPSYLAVMLNMTDTAGGFSPTPRSPIYFSLYNQAFALSVSIALPWHFSCDIPY